jgi:hypothetical protein
MLIGDTFERCLWKTSMIKVNNNEVREMAMLALHLSGITVSVNEPKKEISETRDDSTDTDGG